MGNCAKFDDQSKVEYAYDAFMQKMARTESYVNPRQQQPNATGELDLSTQQMYYLNDGLNVMKEYDENLDPVAQYYEANGQIISRRAFTYTGRDNIDIELNKPSNPQVHGMLRGDMIYYLNDSLGSVTHITDRTGETLEQYRYDAFGSMMTPFTPEYNTLGYTNQNIDPKTGLMDYNARWYNPNAGRFITEDTYEGLIHEPLSLNRYTYVYNNPLIYTDPSGHIPTVMEAAVMAKHIYGATLANDKNKDIIDGWKLIDVKGNTEGPGLKMGIYSRMTSDGKFEYALVNKGSGKNVSDWINNFQQPFGDSNDMKGSIFTSEYFVANHKNAEITMVGHSKGGAEAVANAVANNKNAITFNPAIPNLRGYGLSDLDYTASVTNYVVTGEALNGIFGEVPTGTTVYLKQQVFFDENNVRENKGYNQWWVLYDKAKEKSKVAIANHSMDSVISALKEKRYK